MGKQSSICSPIGASDATDLPTYCIVHRLSKSRPDVLTVRARLPNAFSADDHAGHVPGDRPYTWAGYAHGCDGCGLAPMANVTHRRRPRVVAVSAAEVCQRSKKAFSVNGRR